MAVENTTEDDTEIAPVEGAAGAEVNTPSLLDSINEALAPTLPKTDEIADTNGEGVDDKEDDDEDDKEDEGDAEGVTIDAKGRKHGPDGKLLPADKQTEAPKLGPDGKPLVVDPAAAAAAAKKADPVNDPIPDEIKGRTRDRIQALITTAKEQGEMIVVQNQLFDSIKSTGASPEEFGAMLGYMRWIHSDKPEDLKQARELLLSELEGLSLKIGEAAPGINFLAKFPDLQEKVNNGQITVEDANEMALHRQRTKVNTDRSTLQRTQEETTQAATKERNDAIKELDALGKTLSTDAEFATKHQILQPVLSSLGMLPPSKWKAAFMQAYRAITPAQVARYKAAAEPVVVGKPAGKGQQPLRANKTPSGGQNRQAANMHDAIFGEGFPE